MKLLCAVCAALLLSVFGAWSLADGADASSSIQATATVVEPIGLLDAQQMADDFATPVIAEYSSRCFLYLPRHGSVLVQLDGEPLATASSSADGNIVSLLDLSNLAAGRSQNDSVVVTVIFSEN